MSARTLALNWSIDGSDGAAFLLVVGMLAITYLAAAAHGNRHDRRGRRWPARRTICFLSGLLALVVDLYSGIGIEADTRLSVHMLEHMLIWMVVAPLIVAGAPVRLAFYSLPRSRRRTLARLLHSPVVRAVTGPLGSVVLYAIVLLVTHLPAVYGLALENTYVHESEHALYLITSVLVWAPILAVDPLPHRLSPRARIACMGACMVPMAVVAGWLASAPQPVYGHYLQALGPRTLADQRLAAMIMLAAGLPTFLAPLWGLPRTSLAWIRRLLRSRVHSGVAALTDNTQSRPELNRVGADPEIG